MKTLNSMDHKKMAVLFIDHLIHNQYTSKSKTISSTADTMGVSSCSLRRWCKDFYRNNGEFTKDKHGKHERLFLLNEEKPKRKMVAWLRAKVADKSYQLSACKFQQWCNSYLSTAQLPEGYRTEISESTALRYMKRLGFKNGIFKQGLYVDGHEHKNAVAYREIYLKKMKILESRHLPPPREDQLPSCHAGQPTMNKHLVIIYHDESTFNAYDAPSRQWVVPSGSGAIRPKWNHGQ